MELCENFLDPLVGLLSEFVSCGVPLSECLPGLQRTRVHRRNVGDPLRALLKRCTGYLESFGERIEGDADALLTVIVINNGFTCHDHVQARQSLLAVDNLCLRGLRLRSSADRLGVLVTGDVPEHQLADGKPSVEGVDEVTNFHLFPYEGALDVRKSQRAGLHRRNEVLDRPRNRLEEIAH